MPHLPWHLHPIQSSSSASTKLHPSVRISTSTRSAILLSTSSISRVQNTRARPSSLIRTSLSRTICTTAVSSSPSSLSPSAPASAAPNLSRTSLSTSSPTAASTWPRTSSANRPRSNSKLSCTPCATSPRTSSRSRIRAASGLVNVPLRIRTSPSASTLRFEAADDGGDGEHDDEDGHDDAGLVSVSTTRRCATVRVLLGVRKADGLGWGEGSSIPPTGVTGRPPDVGVAEREGACSGDQAVRESSARISVEARGRRVVRPRAKGARALRGIPWPMSRKKGSTSMTSAGISRPRSAPGAGGRFVEGFLSIGIAVSVVRG
ncbi:hypothetical protein CGRA01v4_14895 [Colletotrichum graminicola]|uniref:Uncharacterized protein n=1 Tax=Colletotrichum graminicola (strain M1.001 / M2 / FGSC 10212) TaxID=645133 RepID=E3QFH5_COLGM|nr:uncharacterized protein GLRG_04757 [Colletotrichum graminicola M1.001]EFQ29613.1 hypothetical protein GLRG_04757 [Colletotrichum graminicola M1.001]WDK23603.1 hypothetical protein CGRA01v4_14895 [Colletotrichum graminicola]